MSIVNHNIDVLVPERSFVTGSTSTLPFEESDYECAEQHTSELDDCGNGVGGTVFEGACVDSVQNVSKSMVSEVNNPGLNDGNSAAEKVQASFQDKLANWAIENNINHSSLSKLLTILKEHPCHSSLPLDARTLLRTPRATVVKDMAPGKFCYFGLLSAIKIALSHCPSDAIPCNIQLLMCVDGLPLSKSTASQFWPILCTLLNGQKKLFGPFVVGIYHGNAKPSSATEFLRDFVDDVKNLMDTGIEYNNKIVTVKLHAIVCDAPAKAFITCTKGHNGYFSCSKCLQEGKYIHGRVCYPSLKYTMRTDEGFQNREQEEHHIGHSPLEEISNFGMVTQITLDYLHLICLGVMRKLLNLWLRAEIPVRLGSRAVKSISANLLRLKTSIPEEFARKPRDLKELDRWKGTEFRQLLLYTGPLVLHSELPADKYKDFMTLHSAVSILASEKYCQVFNEYANSLLHHFVKTFSALYGPENVSHNVHGLLHLADDVKKYGPLDAFSAFQFENYMQSFKKLVRKAEKPLQQISSRLQEIQNFGSNHVGKLVPLGSISYNFVHGNGPLLEFCMDPQYKRATFNSFSILLDDANNCCGFKDGSIVKVENIAFNQDSNCMVFVGRQFLDLTNLYTIPCDSSLIEVFLCGPNMSTLKQWPAIDCVVKYVKLPFKDSYAVLPLIHTNN
jgi:hypothetical protein